MAPPPSGRPTPRTPVRRLRPPFAGSGGRPEGHPDHGPGFRAPPAHPIRGLRGPGPRARGCGLGRAGRRSPGAVAQITDKLVCERFVAAGVLTEADFDELHRAYKDRSFWF